MAQASTSCSFKQIAREQKVCLRIFEAGTCSGVILAFARRMKPWISADFGQWEVRAEKCLWFFRRSTPKCCKPPLSICPKKKKICSHQLFSFSNALGVLFALSAIPAQRWKCWYSYLWVLWYYHLRGGGLPILPEILVNVFRAGRFCFHVPKTSSRKSWMPQVRSHPPGALLWSALSWRNNYIPVDQIPPREWAGIIFAISPDCSGQLVPPDRSGSSKIRFFLKDISFISAFYSRGFAAGEEF